MSFIFFVLFHKKIQYISKLYLVIIRKQVYNDRKGGEYMDYNLKKKEVAKMFNVTEKTIDNWRRTRGLKSISITPNTVRFSIEDVEEFKKRG